MFRMLVVVVTMLIVGCAGTEPVTETDRTFDGIFDVPGASKDQIFNATKIWIAENFRSAKSVIEYENKEEGTLIGNGVIPYPCVDFECVGTNDWKVPFTMRVDMKDDKFRLRFSNIRLSWPPSYNSTYGSRAGHDGPVRTQGSMDAIKPKLLDFGPQLAAAIHQNRGAKDW